MGLAALRVALGPVFFLAPYFQRRVGKGVVYGRGKTIMQFPGAMAALE